MRNLVKPGFVFFGIVVFVQAAFAQPEHQQYQDIVFGAYNGLLSVEAEHYYKQSKTKVRQWYQFSRDESPVVGRDEDANHFFEASNNGYLEVLPDTRENHSDELLPGVNFSNEPGRIAILHYKVHITKPGRYYVWVRAYSTGSEDNGLHVGLNGEWPESGVRLQWCRGKNSWQWESRQRTAEQHCGVPHQIYLDIEEEGEHEIMFSMREDGFEFDKFLLTTDRDYIPNGFGPQPLVKKGKMPEPLPGAGTKGSGYLEVFDKNNFEGIKLIKAVDFSTDNTGLFLERDRWLSVDSDINSKGSASVRYGGNEMIGAITILGVGENGGKSKYGLLINGKEIGEYQAPISETDWEENAAYCMTFDSVRLKEGDMISVRAEIGSANFANWTHARFAGIIVSDQDALPVLSILKNLMPEARLKRPAENVIPTISGELKKWHKISLTFAGPFASEEAEDNPFMNYRFNVTFSHKPSGKSYLVPGYFAADGDAGNTSAHEGNKWRVHFSPDETGQWDYEVDFVKGNFAAVSERKNPGKPAGYMNGSFGSFTVAPTDKLPIDFRGKGRLQYVGERYLKFAETGEYFLKVGADAPENFLSFADFDGTFHADGEKDELVKTWGPHLRHWQTDDPVWKSGKGKGIIGAVNYLASKGMNAVSFITMNIEGDDRNVFPYIDYHTYDRMDCSKLDQWEMVFEHAQSLGLFLHFKLMEHENQGLLDNGGVGANSKLYYREMIARFGHHLALNWNMCEENGDWTNNPHTPPQFTMQRLSMAAYFEKHDPYKHHRVIHNGAWFSDLYGPASQYTGASLQTSREDFSLVHSKTLAIINDSKAAGKQWAVACDEPGDHRYALVPDAINPEHHNARMNGLWGNFMAGGWGTEWYFGYAHEHSDLTCQDYASRDKFWEQGRIALDFFIQNEIPFWEMENHNELLSNETDYVLASPGEIYVLYLKSGSGIVNLESANEKLKVYWYNPRTGGDLITTTVKSVNPGSSVELGEPPVNDGLDWVVLLKKD